MAQGNNVVKCPQCEHENSFLVSTVNGHQFLLCNGCKTLLKVEIKKGQYTGKVQA